MSKGNNPNPSLIDMRRKDAKERQDAYDKLSLKEKLDRLDRKFPDGAKKQRARLLKALEKPSVVVKVEEPVKVSKDVLEAPSKRRREGK